MSSKRPWYDRKIIVIILIIAFFPVGLYGLWKSSVFSRKGKVAWTIGILAMAIIGSINQPPPTSPPETVAKPQQAAPGPAPDPAKEQTNGDKIVVNLTEKNQLPATESPTQEASQQQTKPATAVQPRDLRLTLAELIQRYNQSFQTLQQDTKFRIKDKKANGDHLTVQLHSNTKNIGVVATGNSKTRKIDSMIFIGTGDGTINSGVAILMGAAATVMAIENPKMTREQRGKILSDIGLSNKKLRSGGRRSFERNGVKYTAILSKETGFMLTADPV